MENNIGLDFLGEVYALTAGEKHLGTFSITARLREDVNVQILRQAVADLAARQPYISGYLTDDLRYKLLTQPPQVIEDIGLPVFSAYYNEGDGHVLRVIYGERHITVETAHFMTDGRGLSKIASALFVRYFELLGVEIGDKGDIMDCNGTALPEETEDAFARYGGKEKPKPNKDKLKGKAYKHQHLQSCVTKVAARTFDLAKIKESAKASGVTVGGYVAACIFSAIAKERDASGNKQPIVMNIPVDFRSFLPSGTIRNFVGSKNIAMPEKAEFSAMAQQVQQQFATINAEFAQAAADEFFVAKKALGRMPRWLKKFLLKTMNHFGFKKITTMLSNLGLVRLPKEVEQRIENLEFVISPTDSTPYTFACTAVGNALTLSVTADVDGDIAENVFAMLEENQG